MRGGERLWGVVRSDALRHNPIPLTSLPSCSLEAACCSAWHLPSPKVVWPFKASFLARAHVFFGNYKAFRALFTTLSTVCFVLHFFWFVLFPAPLIFHCNIEDCFCVYGLQHRVGNWYLLIEISILREDRYIVYKALQIIPKLFVSIPEDVFWTIYIVA